MPSKRAAARRDAAETVDVDSRLAPFFPPPPAIEGQTRTDAGDTFETRTQID